MAQRRTVKDAGTDHIDDIDTDDIDDIATDDIDDTATDDIEDSDAAAERDTPPRRRRLSAGKAGQLGLRQIMELTGKDPEGVSGVEPSDDGWLVTVEVVEDRRIPSSSDLLATYRIELDGDGELLSYRRLRRYSRGRGDDGDA